MYEKVYEREDIAKYQLTPVDTKWIDTDKAFEREPMQIRSRIVARELKNEDRPDLYAGTPPLGPLKCIRSIAAIHKKTFSFMHVDVSRAYFHAKSQRLVLVRLPAGDRMGADAGTVGLLKKSMCGTRDAASTWECDWHVKNWGVRLGLRSKTLFYQEGHQISGMTHGDDFVLTGPTAQLKEFDSKMKGVFLIKANTIRHGSSESIKALNRRLHWRKRGIVHQHDPRHVDVFARARGIEHGNTVQTPATHDVTEGEAKPLDHVQHSKYRSQVTR